MARQYPTPRSIVRRLRPSPENIAAAAALHDPGPLLRLQADPCMARARRRRAGTPAGGDCRSETRWRERPAHRPPAGIGFTVAPPIASRAFHGSLLDEAKVGILATALLAPVLAVAALAPLRASPTRA
jgi:hypothetical protein